MVKCHRCKKQLGIEISAQAPRAGAQPNDYIIKFGIKENGRAYTWRICLECIRDENQVNCAEVMP